MIKKIIDYIKFGLLSEEDKIVLSNNIEITEYKGHKYKFFENGSMYDKRMGAILSNRCQLCGLNVKECPGHFGRIKLATLVFHPVFLKTIKNIASCFCSKCGFNLISDLVKNESLTYKKRNRLKFVFKSVESLKKKRHVICGICSYSVDNNVLYTLKTSTNGITYKDKNDKIVLLYPEDVFNVFNKLTPIDLEMLGLDYKYSHPQNMILKSILVPPHTIRPFITGLDFKSGGNMEDNLFKTFNQIVEVNESLKLELLKNPNIRKNEGIADMLNMTIAASYIDTQNKSGGEFQFKTVSGQSKLMSLTEKFKGKKGMLRDNIQGKRLNMCARTVLGPDKDIHINELGISKTVAMKLPVKVQINRYNINEFREYIENGSDIYPGAKYIISDGSTRKIKTPKTAEEKKINKQIKKSLKIGDYVGRHILDGDYGLFNRQPSLHKLSINAHKIKVLPSESRVLRTNVCATDPYNADYDGDEGTLYIMSSFESIAEAKIVMNLRNSVINDTNSKTIIGPKQDNVLGGYLISINRDVEIDKKMFMDIIFKTEYYNKVALKGFKSKKIKQIELFNLICPEDFSYKLISPVTISISNGIVKDFSNLNLHVAENISKKFKLTHLPIKEVVNLFTNKHKNYIDNYLTIIGFGIKIKGKLFNERIIKKIKYKINKFPIKRISNELSINECFSLIFPKDFSCQYKLIPDVDIINGKLISGHLTKKVISKIIKNIAIMYDNTRCIKFILAYQNITDRFLAYNGITMSILDCFIPNKVVKSIFQQNLTNMKRSNSKIIESFDQKNIKIPYTQTPQSVFELMVNNISINKYTLLNYRLLEEYINYYTHNNFTVIYKSGTKGSIHDVYQILVAVGQQKIDGERMEFGYNERSMPFFQKYDLTLRSRGFIFNSFVSGLDVDEYFWNGRVGRGGVADTSLKTKDTGYMSRELVKILESIVFAYDNTVRQTNKKIISYTFGTNNYDTRYLYNYNFNLRNLSTKKFFEEFV